MHSRLNARVVQAAGVAVVALLAVAWAGSGPEEQERKVKESEVPAPALKALRELAGNAAISAFAEEIEHGCTYYEGSWKGPKGNVDALVTAAGDLVEIEEEVPVDAVPKAILDSVRKDAGADAKLFAEKKTVVYYEIKYKKGDKRHEVIYGPDGRKHEHEEEKSTSDLDD